MSLHCHCQCPCIMTIHYLDHILSFASGAAASGLLKCGCGLNVEAFFTFWMFIFGNFVVASFFLIVVDVVVIGWEMTEGVVISSAPEKRLSVPWFELGLLLAYLWFWNILLLVAVVCFSDVVVAKTSWSENCWDSLVGDFVLVVVLWDVVAFLIRLVVCTDLRVDVVGGLIVEVFNLGLTWSQDLNKNWNYCKCSQTLMSQNLPKR